MSLAGMVRVRGSRCTVKGVTDGFAPDGSVRKTPAIRSTNVPVLLTPVSQRSVQYEWGQEVRADFTGLCEVAAGVQQDDVLLVTAGNHLGRKFTVQRISPPQSLQGVAHNNLWLLTTGEPY